MLFGHFEVNFWSYEGSENGKLQKVSPKGNYKEKCIGLHKLTTFSRKRNSFSHSVAHFRHMEGSENGKVQKVSPKSNYEEKCLGWHKIHHF